MTEQQWSTDTRDLVAATIADHTQDIKGRSGEGHWGTIGCSCGHHHVTVTSAADVLAGMREHGEHVADAVLTALAGSLLPAGGQTSDEWRVTYRHNCHPTLAGVPAGPCRTVPHRELWLTAISEANARRGLATCRDEAKWPEPRMEQRSVTRWPDGSTHHSPWREVADG